jgi:hypothetical protein
MSGVRFGLEDWATVDPLVPAGSADALAAKVEPPDAVMVGPLFDGAAEDIEPAGVVIPLFDGAAEGVGPGLGGGVVLFCALTRAGRNRAMAKARENFMVRRHRDSGSGSQDLLFVSPNYVQTPHSSTRGAIAKSWLRRCMTVCQLNDFFKLARVVFLRNGKAQGSSESLTVRNCPPGADNPTIVTWQSISSHDGLVAHLILDEPGPAAGYSTVMKALVDKA